MQKRSRKEAPIHGETITRPQMAEMAGVSVPTMRRRLRSDPHAPRPLNTGGAREKWGRQEIEYWLKHGDQWRAVLTAVGA